MAIIGTANIYIEPDDQYTTITVWRDDQVGGQNLITPSQNQTISAAFNKARDDLASLLGGGIKVKNVTITMRAE